ncbi:MAG: hypothetical protein IKS94_02750 [Prevotella sp.]|nr:hypothetical protein [Prevotella sp.]
MNSIKLKFHFLDLTICAVWMLFACGIYGGWLTPAFVIIMLAMFYRFVVSLSLSKMEIRSWLPLLIFAPFAAWFVFSNHYITEHIADYFFHLTHIEYNNVIYDVIVYFFLLWLVAVPYIYYLYLLIRKKALRTELTWGELVGAILWRDRQSQTISAILMVMLFAFISGLTMSARACQLMCFAAVPVTYWLICRYHRVSAEKAWVLVMAMVTFWYAQIQAGVWRVSLLFLSFALVIYVVIALYQKIKKVQLSIVLVIYLGILLPSFSIGYNQYACTHYARSGFHYLEPFKGILYITDGKGHYGLRDRYGLLIEPEYESIRVGEKLTSKWSHLYILQKDGHKKYYDVFNDKFVQETEAAKRMENERK